MIPAAVEKCEDQRKPEAFFGYRKAEERQTEDLRVPGKVNCRSRQERAAWAVRFLESPPYGRMPESGQKGRTVNPLASAYVGSNPTSPTIRKTLTTGERNFVEQQSPGPLRI